MSEKNLRRQLESLFSDLKKSGAAPAPQEPPVVPSPGAANASELDELCAENERLRQAVQERETAFQAFLDEIPVGYHELDAEGRITRVNRTELVMLGYTAKEMIGRPAWEFVADPDTSHRAVLDKLAGQLAMKTTEREFVRKDGIHVPVLIQDKHLLDAEGNIIGIRTTVQDISERKRVEESLHRQNMELATLHETAMGLLNQMEPARLIETILTRAAELAGTSHGYLYILEPGEQSMVVRVGIGAFADRVGYQLKHGQGVAGKAWEQNAPVVVDDYQTWKGRQPGFDWLHAVASIPLHSGSRVIGVLSLGHLERGKTFGPEAVKLLDRFAKMASLTLANAQLLEETERRITALSILNEISREFSAALSVDELYSIVHRQVGRVFDTTDFYIAAYEENSDEWTLAFGFEHGQLLPFARHPLGTGLTSHIIHTRQPILLRTAQENIEFSRRHNLPPVGETARSWMGIPLIAAGKIIGVMGLQSYEQENLYGEQDLALFSTIGAQVANAIQNARLFEETRARAERLSILTDIGRQLSSALSLEDLYRVVHQQAGRIFDTSSFFIGTFEEGSDHWEMAYRIENGQPAELGPRSLQAGLGSYMIKTQKPLMFNSAQELEDFYQLHQISQLGLSGTKSWMGVPLITAGRVVGVMAIQNYQLEHLYSEQDQSLFATIGAQTATAIQNARLFGETQRRITDLSILNEISQAFASVQNLDQLFENIYRQVGRVFDVTNFHIATYEEASSEWTMAFQMEGNQRLPSGPRALGPGLTSQIIRTRQPILLHSAEENSRYFQDLGIERVGRQARSWMGVPLLAGGRIVGVMAVQSYEREYFYDEQDMELFSTIGAQAGVAMENARLFEETSRRAQEVAALNDLGQRLTSQLDLNQVLDEVYQGASCLLDTSGFYIALYNADKNEVFFAVNASESAIDREITTMPADQGITGYIIRSRASLLLKDNIAGWLRQVGLETVGEPAQSWLGAPLMIGDQMLGVISVQNYTTPGTYDEHDRDLLVAIANQAAIAIQNARLFDETRARAEELAVLNEMSRTLSAMLDIDAMIKQIYDSTSRLMDTTNFFVALYDARLDEVSFPFYAEGDRIRALASRRRGGKGLTEYVIRTHAPLLIEEHVTERLKELGIESIGVESQSWLGVPLTVGDQSIGVAAVQSYTTPRCYNQRQRDLLVTIAGQAAIAIQNARLFQEARARAEEMAALNNLSRALTEHLTLEGVLEEAYRGASRLMNTNSFAVALYDQDKDEISFPFDVSDGQHVEDGITLSSAQGMTGYVVRHRTPLFIKEGVVEWRVQQGVQAIGPQLGAQSWLGVPMMMGDRVLGVLIVQSYSTPNAFDEHDQEVLVAIANQTAIALQNARLFGQAQVRARRERILREVTTRVRSSTDPDTIVRTAVRELGMALGRPAFIRLGSPEQLSQRGGDGQRLTPQGGESNETL